MWQARNNSGFVGCWVKETTANAAPLLSCFARPASSPPRSSSCSVAWCLWKLRRSSLPTSGPWMIISVAIRQQSTTESDWWCGSVNPGGLFSTQLLWVMSSVVFTPQKENYRVREDTRVRRPNKRQYQRVLFSSIGLQVFVLFCCLFRFVIQHTSDVCFGSLLCCCGAQN